jgi:aryl-alcohol dehydrogenase-like predicted oxidoreductase
LNPQKIILGTVQFGLEYGINNVSGQVPENEVFQILSHAYHSSIDTLDTAEGYGNAHEVIGNYHRNNPDKKFKVITKITEFGNSDLIAEKVKKILDELFVEQLEALMFHSFPQYKNSPELVDRLTELKHKKNCKALGVSVYNNEQLEEVIDDDAIDLIQLPFNLLDNLSRRGFLLEKAKQKGKIIHTRSAFLQGLFFKDPSSDNPIAIQLKKQLEEIRLIAGAGNMPVASLALNYCLQQPLIDRVLIGVDSLEQLKANIAAASGKLNQGILSEVDRIQVPGEDLLNPSLW